MSASYARTPVAALAAACLTTQAFASCGSAFCNVNTNWVAQLPPSGPGTRLDVNFEYIDQNQPRAGNRDVAVGQIPQHHDEVKTINRDTILRLDHNFDENWGFTARLPLINREHEHIHNHRGAKLPETWSFTQPGDAVLAGRYQIQGEHPANTYGMTWGLKLPTGSYSVRNRAGELAERSLQPGLGRPMPYFRCSGTIRCRFQTVDGSPRRWATYRSTLRTDTVPETSCCSISATPITRSTNSSYRCSSTPSRKGATAAGSRAQRQRQTGGRAQSGRQLCRIRQYAPLWVRPGADLPIR